MSIANENEPLYLLLLRPKSCKEEPYRDEFDPLEVFDEVFDCYHFHQLRLDLWELVKAGMKDEDTYGPREKINGLLFLHDVIVDMVTACYRIAKERHLKNSMTDTH